MLIAGKPLLPLLLLLFLNTSITCNSEQTHRTDRVYWEMMWSLFRWWLSALMEVWTVSTLTSGGADFWDTPSKCFKLVWQGVSGFIWGLSVKKIISDDGWLKSSTGVKRKHCNHAPALEAPTSIPNKLPPPIDVTGTWGGIWRQTAKVSSWLSNSALPLTNRTFNDRWSLRTLTLYTCIHKKHTQMAVLKAHFLEVKTNLRVSPARLLQGSSPGVKGASGR